MTVWRRLPQAGRQHRVPEVGLSDRHPDRAQRAADATSATRRPDRPGRPQPRGHRSSSLGQRPRHDGPGLGHPGTCGRGGARAADRRATRRTSACAGCCTPTMSARTQRSPRSCRSARRRFGDGLRGPVGASPKGWRHGGRSRDRDRAIRLRSVGRRRVGPDRRPTRRARADLRGLPGRSTQPRPAGRGHRAQPPADRRRRRTATSGQVRDHGDRPAPRCAGDGRSRSSGRRRVIRPTPPHCPPVAELTVSDQAIVRVRPPSRRRGGRGSRPADPDRSGLGPRGRRPRG